MNKLMMSMAALAISQLAVSCASIGADSKPSAECVKATGLRLVNRFLSREPEAQNYNRKVIMYHVVCTWTGAIDFTGTCGEKELQKRLTDRFEPFFGPKASYVPTERHVDYSVFGSLPLSIYRCTGDKRCLEMGLGFADRQWTPIPEAKCKWMEGDPNVWLKEGFTPETRLWMDDMFMITSVQLEAYKATGDRKYADRAAKEMVMYLDRLQLKDGPTAGLYHHAPDVPYIWGRGDGWMAAGTARLMQNLPKDQPELPRILEGYRLMMKALKKYQQPGGLWGQLVDDPKIWGESSGTAMFAYAMAVGVNNGWLDREEYAPCVYRAYNALCGLLTPEGDLREVCIGTNKKNDHQYYVDRKRIVGDLHGQAAFLWLCNELVK